MARSYNATHVYNDHSETKVPVSTRHVSYNYKTAQGTALPTSLNAFHLGSFIVDMYPSTQLL